MIRSSHDYLVGSSTLLTFLQRRDRWNNKIGKFQHHKGIKSFIIEDIEAVGPDGVPRALSPIVFKVK